jgi:2-methylisocitrate lyase-like PEP mutase family enzyme
MAGLRRFSQAISEGDGISVIVDVHTIDQARAAQERGAEAIVLRGPVDGLDGATELPALFCGSKSPDEAVAAGADAILLRGLDDEELPGLHARALELGLDCVIEVRDDEALERVLELVDPEILLLTGEDAEAALELLPDVPAGKLAIADVRGATSDEIAELERAGVDAVLVGDAPPAE